MDPGSPSVGARGSKALREQGIVLLLVLSVCLVYLPSLSGGFLNLDDPWLIQHNPVFREPSRQALLEIWSDFSTAARLSLGAEYLPIRDTSVWLDAVCDGLAPGAMRFGNLAIYVTAVLCLRGALRRALGTTLAVEIAVFAFALHPVHVESVAWLAGRKDVLALLFVALALYVHSGVSRLRPIIVPALLVCAYLAKAQAVVAGGLLVAHDLLARRRPEARVYAPVFASAVMAAMLHAYVGRVVGMTGTPAGGSRLHAAYTFADVLARYLGMLVCPARLSVVYDVPARLQLTLAGALGLGVVFAWLGIGIMVWRRRQNRVVLAAWLWLVVPLLPVSQVLFPLQNRMADRYLLFSVLALSLLLWFALERVPAKLRIHARGAAIVAVLGLGLASFERSALFGNSASLFEDATHKTRTSQLAPLQWALALEAKNDRPGAEAAYKEVLRRSSSATEAGRRATNNLARAYARENRLDDAAKLLRAGRGLWPADPKILSNLSIICARQGKSAEAEQLAAELHQRFPNFRPGQRSISDYYSSQP
jgi:hypothetical protein